MRMRIATVALLATVGALAMFSQAAMAESAGPGWQLFATTYPTNLVQGVDEVQEATATEETGTFVLSYEEVETSPLPDHATDVEVQSALEGLSSVGAGNVSVTGSTPGSYTVTFVSVLGNMRTAELEASRASTAVTIPGSSSGTVGIDVFNVGAGDSKGTITVTDRLPEGVKAKSAGRLLRPGGEASFGIVPRLQRGVWDCTGNGPGPAPGVAGATIVTCKNDPVGLEVFAGGGGTPTFSPGAEANPQPAVGIAVEITKEAKEGAKEGVEGNHATIAGGGAIEPASTTDPVTISSEPAHGGLTQADAWFSNADGTIDRQAGSHPYTATFVFALATALNDEKEAYLPGSEIRDLETQTPPGFIGDLHAVTQCTRPELFNQECPPASEVGRLKVSTPELGAEEQVFNMVPVAGTPAELGFNYADVPVYISFSVKSGSDYGLVAHVTNIPQRIVYQSILTLWGVPEDPSHDLWRNDEGGCTPAEIAVSKNINGAPDYCSEPQGPAITPFLRLPTSCGEPQPFLFRELHGWQEPNATSEVGFLSHDASDNPAGFSGCELLGIEPAFAASLDTTSLDSPTGLTADVKPPLAGLEEATGFSPADIQGTTVTLPEGLVVNPGQAAGLTACPAGRPSPGGFGDGLTTAEEAARGEEDAGPASCPQSSKVGTVTIKSPLIEADGEKQFEGNVYVLQSNPPEIKLLVAASADGVNVKQVGTVHLNEQTGRVVATFASIPQLPFSDLQVSFEGGVRAALDTPTKCTTSAVEADFTPWSAPLSEDSFQTAAVGIGQGAACPSPLPFAPTLTVGSTSDQAGEFTDFTAQLQRGDGQQRVEKLSFTAPAGLSAMISKVPLCDEADANAGTCPAASHIGHAVVSSGPGANPLVLPQPGEPELGIFLTGPYKGAPFGLSIVTPVIAGPFNLGTIVTRASIAVDPHTAQVTVTTDPLPQIVKGVPTDLRSIEAVIDRAGFMFNPTNCNAQSFSGTATSVGGAANVPISTPFGVGSCQSLKFAPKFAVSTPAKASKAQGAGLTVKLTYPKAAQGTQANIKAVKVDLPKQLPSQLKTLQKACLAATFEANPLNCPKHSVVGQATVTTPLLPVPLTGKAYFVSHGGEAFPSLTMVLKGDNVTIDLVGSTLIKKGITSTTFKTVPDVPFSTFTLTLNQGEYAALGANLPASAKHSFCGQKLTMPTAFVGQNGAEIHESTAIGVSGCPKAKKTKKAKGKSRKKK